MSGKDLIGLPDENEKPSKGLFGEQNKNRNLTLKRLVYRRGPYVSEPQPFSGQGYCLGEEVPSAAGAGNAASTAPAQQMNDIASAGEFL
ncbi:unnamed protein product [Gongylonema pulchrum]|uniref:Uncharacterized protein n=1 Tax=Gongylonema pulchrum TaxID=637853 RepID=A0A183E7R6_9BILA|nr:unnamed protein product [Gongylonema pulchrum]